MLTFLLTTMLILARESETTTETVPMTGLTATAPAADLAWNVAVNLWQDTKPPAAPGPVPPPPGSDAQPVAAESVATAPDSAAPADTETDYVFVIKSELLPIGTLVMTQDRVIKTLGRPPVVKLQDVVIRSSWRQPNSVRQQIANITAAASAPIVADPLPPAAPVSEPLD